MTEPPNKKSPPGDSQVNDDLALRRALQTPEVTTSADHDAAVLAAAHEAAAEIAGQPDATAPSAPGRRLLWPLLAAAATLLFGFVVLINTVSDTGGYDDVVRGVTAAVEPGHEHTLHQAPTQFRWDPVAGAQGYQLVLMDAAADPVWTTSVTHAQVNLPDQQQSALQPGSTYIWTVTPKPAGTVLGPFWFRIQP